MNTDESPVQLADTPYPEAVATDAIVEVKEKKKKKNKKDDGKPEKKVKVGSERGIETMFRTSYRTHVDMSSLADTKANIMISINGIIISIIIASAASKIETTPWLLLPTTVLLIGCLISMVYAVLAARPRVSKTPLTLEKVRRENTNILFFGNFVSLSEDDFRQGIAELMQAPDRLYENMVRDIYGLGRVLDRKFTLLRIAYTVFMFCLVASVALYIGVYLAMVFAQPYSPPAL